MGSLTLLTPRNLAQISFEKYYLQGAKRCTDYKV